MDLDAWLVATCLVKLAIYVGSVLAVGSALFRIIFATQVRSLSRGLSAGILVGVICAILATLIQLGLNAGALTGEGLIGMVEPDMLTLVWQGPAGDAAAIRILGSLLLVFSILVRGSFSLVLGILGSVVLVISFSLVGHANDGPGYLLHVLLTAHVLAVSYWVGALLPLRTLAKYADLSKAAEVADRFGRIALWTVGGLVVTGVAMAWTLLGSPQALIGSSYGQTLGLKILIVCSLLALAAINKLHLVPSMRLGDRVAATRLVRSIDAEIVLILIVSATTAALTTSFAIPA